MHPSRPSLLTTALYSSTSFGLHSASEVCHDCCCRQFCRQYCSFTILSLGLIRLMRFIYAILYGCVVKLWSVREASCGHPANSLLWKAQAPDDKQAVRALSSCRRAPGARGQNSLQASLRSCLHKRGLGRVRILSRKGVQVRRKQGGGRPKRPPLLCRQKSRCQKHASCIPC